VTQEGEASAAKAPKASPALAEPSALPPDARRALRLGLLLMVLLRVVYHVAFVLYDPFALVTFSDGQLYEEAARDIVAHAPLGTQPFYLQGLYAYLLALGMSLHTAILNALLLQLLVAACALWLFARAARSVLGPWLGSLSTLVLLCYPNVAFYENKYLSVALGIACNVTVLWAFVTFDRKPSTGRALLLGVCSGLSVLGRANLLLALPMSAWAVWLSCRARQRTPTPVMLGFLAGVLLALAPMAARNLVVTGHPDVLPSHGGGIPFYIGNNPHANGRWNDAGGLLTGQVDLERDQLAQGLGITGQGRALDDALGRALYRRAFGFIVSQPGAWLLLEAKKLYCTLGNHDFVRDYDLFGERELLGNLPLPMGIPFGVLLALGALGLWILHTESRGNAPGALQRRALFWVLLGQLVAVLAANLLWFSSAQNRVPLAIPLAFAAGPGVLALAKRVGRKLQTPWPGRASWTAVALCGLLCAQAFWPRMDTYRASSVHYYNLANVEETLGRGEDALAHYRLSVEHNPHQPMFRLREAHLARLLGKRERAEQALTRLSEMQDVPPDIRRAAAREQRLLTQGP
jgi:hypothetical protein